jgi:pimeloyl-ACP methyl ester carboxylesterase
LYANLPPMPAPRLVRWFLKGLLGLVVILVVVLASGLLYRAWRQNQAEATMTISSANGIDESTFLRIGNTRHWISIRGQDRSKPVVLLVHGGPGASLGAMAPSFVPWERDYVVVQWDQPGAGRTFGEAGRVFDPSLTIESIAGDGIRVAEHLTSRLGQDRIILVGWSWGSALGIHMIKARPDLFAAFVGTGQVVNMTEGEALAYARVLEKARKRGDADAVSELEQIGPPPYEALQELGAQRKWASAYEGYASDVELLFDWLVAPRVSLANTYDFVTGLIQSQNHFFGPAMNRPFVTTDLRQLGLEFAVPIFVVQGTEDDYTPAALSRAYVEELRAPDKEFIPIDGAGHFALVSRPDAFLNAMKERLRRVHQRK